jgi:serine protease Do
MDYYRDNHYERKPRIVSTVLLSVISAILGGINAVVLVPAVYPQSDVLQGGNKVVLHQGEVPPLTGSTGTGDSPVVNIASTVGPAVVGVANFQYRGSIFGGGGMTEVGSGSGFIIDEKNGYIVTNNHVVEGAEKLMISLADGRDIEGTLVGADARTDLAVVKISDTKDLKAVQLGDSHALRAGESVVAIGNPGGREFARTVTTGVVSATDRFLMLQVKPVLTSFRRMPLLIR